MKTIDLEEYMEDKDPDTCYKHNTYNIGVCCPKCIKEKKQL